MAKSAKISTIAALAALLLTACGDSIGDRYVDFAKCLAEKNAVMYGAYWCPHCANQKALFGPQGFEKINYVECDPRGKNAKPEICVDKKVKGYPTWIFADGSRTAGEMTLNQLAEKTTCTLPQDSSPPT